MAGSILGNEVRRVEDPELLTVGGRYVCDHHADGMCHAVFVRSPVTPPPREPPEIFAAMDSWPSGL